MISRGLILIVVMFAVSACVHIPQELRVEEGTQLTNFAQVRTDASQHQGSLARWGGVIAKVENQAENTMLEVVHFDLKSSTRPTPKDDTQGRFRIYHKGLLDPVIFKEGRSITAIGKVGLSEDGKIGEHEYQYPVLNAEHVHLWKEIKQVDVQITHRPMWYVPSMWYYPRHYHPRYYYSSGKQKTTKKSKK